MKTKEEYDKLQAIRDWNAKFKVPAVSTAFWTKEDFAKWEESRKPLPPFEEWVDSLKGES